MATATDTPTHDQVQSVAKERRILSLRLPRPDGVKVTLVHVADNLSDELLLRAVELAVVGLGEDNGAHEDAHAIVELIHHLEGRLEERTAQMIALCKLECAA